MADLANEEKPAIAPPVFVFQKDKAQKRSLDGSSAEDGEDSDKEDSYSPPVKRERTSSLTHFPPSNSVSKNNVFMPSSFCQSPTGNSDSEPVEFNSVRAQNSVAGIVNQYPDTFSGFNVFPLTGKIQLKDDVQPVVHAPRRVPAPLREKLKQELDRMMSLIKSDKES